MEPDRIDRRAVLRRALEDRAGGHPGGGRPPARDRDHDGRRRPPGRAASCSARRARRPAPRRERCSSTARRSAPRPRSRSATGSPSVDLAVRRRTGHRFISPRGGRDADDHGRRDRIRTSSERGPVLEAMGKLIVHAGPLGHGQMVKVINNAVAAANAAVVGEALLVARALGRRPRRADGRDGRRLGRLGDARAEGAGRCARTTTRRCSSSSTCSRTSACASRRGRRPARRSSSAALTREILTAGIGRGHGDDDFAALIEVLEAAADTRL